MAKPETSRTNFGFDMPDFFQTILDQLVSGITAGRPDNLLIVSLGLIATFYLIYRLGGRAWAFLYFATIPFLNWSFGVIETWCFVTPASGEPGRVAFDACLAGPMGLFEKGISFHPLAMVTGFVFVLRDFVQRRMGQRVLLVMALGVAWAFYYAWPVIAIASGLAFAISELADWAIYTFTKYRLSTRILVSSAVASPVDTTVFLFGADLAVQMQLGEPAGTMLHTANWIAFVIGKMVGALFVSRAMRKREDAGLVDPQAI
ncbi:VUT family protein [Ponticaulis sp.]|jgi:hypothetical protein|uniref:VUT family protein n=1 Tax=Ponticaulis sp. TaxID=2020902 RepID=UPI00262313CB|nr:VUT family protein [Ponticaulis sp.]MDF1679286.1 VUT family protein [Ponticaulis sp.]